MPPQDAAGRGRSTQTGVVVSVLMIAPMVIRDPLHSVVALGGIALTAAAVVVVVDRFRRYAADRVPAHLAESSSTTVRVATKAATSYATLLVGFYTVIAVLVVFGVVGHFL